MAGSYSSSLLCFPPPPLKAVTARNLKPKNPGFPDPNIIPVLGFRNIGKNHYFSGTIYPAPPDTVLVGGFLHTHKKKPPIYMVHCQCECFCISSGHGYRTYTHQVEEIIFTEINPPSILVG